MLTAERRASNCRCAARTQFDFSLVGHEQPMEEAHKFFFVGPK
jgi:hypothetical protein